jgi:hypothetical protein
MSVVFPNKKQRRKDCGLFAVKVAIFVDYGTNDGERGPNMSTNIIITTGDIKRVGHVTATAEIYIYLLSHTKKADHLLGQ